MGELDDYDREFNASGEWGHSGPGSADDFDYVEPKPKPASRPNNFIVPSQPGAPVARREVPSNLNSIIQFEDTPTATQHIEVRTSAKDRAEGFVIATRQLGFIFGGAMVAACYLFADLPIFSITALVIFVLTYAATWAYAWSNMQAHSAEGVSLYAAKRKFDIIEYDARQRWAAYHADRKQERQERKEERRGAK